MTDKAFRKLVLQMKGCVVCREYLPLEPRPVFSFSLDSRILVVGQAPGLRVHETGVPWNDPSGDRLREWLGIEREQFYDPSQFGIVPMGLCYPGKGKSGDLPPRKECAPLWMPKVLQAMGKIQLTLLIGKYSQSFFLKDRAKVNLTETVKSFEEYLPKFAVLPHPSPRNNIWLKKNPWFEEDLVPALRKKVHDALR